MSSSNILIEIFVVNYFFKILKYLYCIYKIKISYLDL